MADLDKELETFERHRGVLLGTARGKFVLIHDDAVSGIYESQTDAINEGYRRFGNVPFLVKRVLEIDEAANLASNLLGI